MTEINITDKEGKYIDALIEVAEKEKASIADALTTVADARVTPIEDEEGYCNLCTILGHYNRLLSIIANC